MSRTSRGAKAHRRGHVSEYLALVHLMLKGYHILGFRLKTPSGEIDIVAVKGQRLAVVEVKQRRTLDEALNSVSPEQQRRLWAAGLKLQAKSPRLKHHELQIDLYLIAPYRLPRHIRSAFEGQYR
jgi:putative endonuclease